jgi:hypothetical protein
MAAEVGRHLRLILINQVYEGFKEIPATQCGFGRLPTQE